jgi:RHS repeat-associated protein
MLSAELLCCPLNSQVRSDGTGYYYQQDGMGSVVARVASGSGAVDRYAYGPWGEGIASATGTPHRWLGLRADLETGLVRMGPRAYSPALGRFLQPDPAGYQDGPNLYAYARNSPLAYWDPTGLGAQQLGNRGLCVVCSASAAEGSGARPGDRIRTDPRTGIPIFVQADAAALAAQRAAALRADLSQFRRELGLPAPQPGNATIARVDAPGRTLR